MLDRLAYLSFVSIIIVLGLTIPGCQPSQNRTVRPEGIPYGVERFIDKEAGVACWYLNPHNIRGAGLSCIPLQQTNLRVE